MKTLIILVVACLISSNVFATVPVIDAANLANSAQALASWAKQLVAMKEQLQQAEKQYMATTGSRGLGEILYNQDLYKLLPSEFKAVYDAASSGSYGISGTLSDIAASEQLKGTVAEMQKSIEQRSQHSAFTNKAVGLEAYKAAEQRLKQIETLMGKINETQDLKAINEVQARIAIEQAAIQNEITKLQMIGQLQQAEKRLIEEQKYEMSRRILDSNNKEMPRIK